MPVLLDAGHRVKVYFSRNRLWSCLRGATAEQKAALVRGSTQLLVDVLKEKAQD